MGDDLKAVSYFNKAIALGKSSSSENLSTFLVNLGMAKIKLGLKADANAACQEALLIGRRNNLSDVCAEAEECIKTAATWIISTNKKLPDSDLVSADLFVSSIYLKITAGAGDLILLWKRSN